jgi:hypothetical protein
MYLLDAYNKRVVKRVYIIIDHSHFRTCKNNNYNGPKYLSFAFFIPLLYSSSSSSIMHSS